MISDDDIQRLLTSFTGVFAIKEEVLNSEQRIIEVNESYRNEVLDKMDQVYGEVKILRHEQTVHAQDHEDINRRFSDVESVPIIAHHIKKN